MIDERMFGEVSNKLCSADLAYSRLQFEIDTQELEVAVLRSDRAFVST